MQSYFKKNLSDLTIHDQVENKVALVSLTDGYYRQSTAFKNQLVSLELYAISSDHNNCRGPFKQGVQDCIRLILLEIYQKVFLKIITLRNPNCRSVCLQAVSPTSQYMAWKPDLKFCNRCNAAELEQNVCFCIPTYHYDWSG